MFTLAELEAVLPIVRAGVPATPQYAWPTLKARTGVEVVVKHENHTPIGAFKVRGGLVYVERLKQAKPGPEGHRDGDARQSRAVASPTPARATALPARSWCRSAIRPRRTPPCRRSAPS